MKPKTERQKVGLSAKKFILSTLIVLFLLSGSGVAVAQANTSATQAQILATIQSILQVVELLRTRLNIMNGGAPRGVPGVADQFPDQVAIGQSNDSIKLLQDVLMTNSAISGTPAQYGTFGSDTETALRRFQAAFQLPVTGTFAGVTEYVLNSALVSRPLAANNPATYLTQPLVKTAINSAADAYLLGDQLNASGHVTLLPFPVFSTTTKSSDTATVQRILKTNPTIFRGDVTGVMDSATIQAMVRLRQIYGVQYQIPANGQVNVTNLMDTKATDLITRILTANASAPIKSDLLLRAETAPLRLMPGSLRNLVSVQAVRNYRNNNTEVKVMYEGNVEERFTTTVVSPQSAVSNDIAARLGRPNYEVAGVITFSEVNAKEIKYIVMTFKEYKPNEIDIVVTALDMSTTSERIGVPEINIITDTFFGGDPDRWIQARDKYIADAKKGTTSNDLYDFVALTLGQPLNKVKNLLIVQVLTQPPLDPNEPPPDPCAGGGCGS